MMMMTLAPAVSPTIGAYLAEWVDWRAIFAAARCARRGGVRCGRRAARPRPTTTAAGLDLAGMARAYGTLLRSPAFRRLHGVRRLHQRRRGSPSSPPRRTCCRTPAPAAEHLRADDPAADGDLHGRQRARRPLRAAHRQPAPVLCRPRPRLCRRARPGGRGAGSARSASGCCSCRSRWPRSATG